MNSEKLTSGTASAGVLTAFTASLCCITPVLALISGVSGVAATFSWIDPLRPYLVGTTVLVLGFAWYLQLRPQPKEVDCACEPAHSADGDDEQKKPFIQTKKFLGIVTLVASVLLSFPSYSHIFYPNMEKNPTVEASEINLVTFDVQGMTCVGCEEHVKYAAMKLEGVFNAEASWEQGRATITFDQHITPLDSLIKAINDTGYEVKAVNSIEQIYTSQMMSKEEQTDQ